MRNVLSLTESTEWTEISSFFIIHDGYIEISFSATYIWHTRLPIYDNDIVESL